MGALCASPVPPESTLRPGRGGQTGAPNFGRDPTLRKEDFIVKGKTGEMVVRAPG